MMEYKGAFSMFRCVNC